MSRVFIGIPTINRPEYVREAINSVISQTFSDYEVIVSDNGSDPGVADSIISFIDELNDSRVRFHQQKENVGEYGQGRFFLSKAQDSEYFMILHDDDYLCDNYLEKAIECLETHPESAYFVADADIIDENGNKDESVKQHFLKDHGRDTATQGEFSVIDNHLKCGFTLISGTLFRTGILKKSGFVNEKGVGNYPFETDIFLCLGDLGVNAWYQKEELLTFRFHSGSMRHYIKLMENEKTVNAMVHLFSIRKYTGYAENRRKAILGRLYRAKALIAVRQGRTKESRKYVIEGFKNRFFSIKLWLVSPFVFITPWIFNWILPELPTPREAPLLKHDD